MSYKTIVVYVDASENVGKRIEAAADIALAENAHLIGVAATGVSQFLQDTVSVNRNDPAIAPLLDTLRKRAGVSLEKFDKIADQAGVLSFEHRLIDDDVNGGISLQGAYSDLLVLGQSYPDDPAGANVDTIPYVVLNSGCPVLVVPGTGAYAKIGSKVLIAWNGSMEARRAVHDAIPLLKRAEIVEVAVFNPNSHEGVHGQLPGSDISLYLARHGINIELKEEKSKADVGEALLSLADSMQADLLVMGCYGHSRFRETLLGGVTHTILKSMRLPVLMSH
ncbi:universal stress family protein [Collimonas arenae]|uniref:Universal stress family protein n=1 Tax=Collimonas arenae TaxID=279058 RepID=A0A127PQN5_9BURK|nr:universal stress protein [Collimonas arenae]AMP00120.1 universal stress family protein [Collimonas arenae]AMP10020.1 universal stress family protein [Collimonas arenae]